MADALIQKLLGAYLGTLIFWGVQLGTKLRSLCDVSLKDIVKGTNRLPVVPCKAVAEVSKIGNL